MDILSYLAEVIQTNKEVGVPELGTFFKKKSPGRYDAELHSFLPPSYQLAFSSELTEEALLSEYISKRHNLSEESAIYHIDQFVANLKEKLAEDGEVDLKALGKFVSTGGELMFFANPNLNLGFKFYGLPDTAEEITEKEDVPALETLNIATPEEQFVEVEEIPSIEEITPVATEEVEIETAEEPVEPVSAPEAETLEAIVTENKLEEENPGNLPDEPIYTHEPEVLAKSGENLPPFYKAPVNYQIEEPAPRSTPGYLKAIIAILALLCIVLALFLLKPALFDNITGKNAGLPASPLPDSSITASKLPGATDTLKKDSISQTVPVAPDSLSKDTMPAAKHVSVPPVTKPAPTASTAANNTVAQPVTYEVIGSSVYSEKEAELFIASMKRRWGIDAKIVSKRPGKKMKISIASYKDEKTARAERARLEEKIKIPGLYIYTNTHKQE